MKKIFAFTALLVATGCNSSLENFCEGEEHSFLRETQLAAASIHRKDRMSGRMLASAEKVPEKEQEHADPFVDYTLEDWTEWTMDRLSEMQKIIDDSKLEPEWHELSKELMAISDDLMRFQGTLQSRSKKSGQLSAAYLESILTRSERSKAKFCPKIQHSKTST